MVSSKSEGVCTAMIKKEVNLFAHNQIMQINMKNGLISQQQT